MNYKTKTLNINDQMRLAWAFWISAMLVFASLLLNIYFIYQIANFSYKIKNSRDELKQEEIVFQNIGGEYFGKVGGVGEAQVLESGFVKIHDPKFLSRVSSIAFNR